MTDSRVRKSLSALNVKLGFPSSFFTFHAFQHSGATLGYKAHAPIQSIKDQGTWTSECVWRYIQFDGDNSDSVAVALQRSLV